MRESAPSAKRKRSGPRPKRSAAASRARVESGSGIGGDGGQPLLHGRAEPGRGAGGVEIGAEVEDGRGRQARGLGQESKIAAVGALVHPPRI